MKTAYKVLFTTALSIIVLLQSCGINSNHMFKEAKGDVVTDSIPLHPTVEYTISPNDKITFNLSTNNGTEIIERMTGLDNQRLLSADKNYLVRPNGEVELPVIGIVNVQGLTVTQCEDTLIKLFSKEYKDPFIQVRVTNQRVVVFPGNGGDAVVVPLTENNTTLVEALATAGGITERGKAKSIKVLRKINGVRTVYTIDLSTIEGLQYADMIVQANDYIYVEPTPELLQQAARDAVPIISLFSSALFIVSAINLIK